MATWRPQPRARSVRTVGQQRWVPVAPYCDPRKGPKLGDVSVFPDWTVYKGLHLSSFGADGRFTWASQLPRAGAMGPAPGLGCAHATKCHR